MGGKGGRAESTICWSYRARKKTSMMNHIMRFVREEEGATALEYGLVAALIAAAIIGAVTALGTSVSNTFTNL